MRVMEGESSVIYIGPREIFVLPRRTGIAMLRKT